MTEHAHGGASLDPVRQRMAAELASASQDVVACARSLLGGRERIALYETNDFVAVRHAPARGATDGTDDSEHLRQLIAAIAASAPEVLMSYVDWARAVLTARNQPIANLCVQLSCLRDAVEQLVPSATEVTSALIDRALERLLSQYVEPEPACARESPAGRYLACLLACDRRAAVQLVDTLIAGDLSVREVYLTVVQPAQHELGRLWQLDRLTVAQEHAATAVSQLVIARLYATWMKPLPRDAPRAVVACVEGELHELGARMVADFLEMDGWDVSYLGASTPAAGVVRFVREQRSELLAVSASLGSHLRRVAELVRTLRAQADLAHVKVLVGGHPFYTAAALWTRLGADGFGTDAEDAVRVARSLRSDTGP